MGELDNRVAMVSGGAQGLGRAHSMALAREGAIVIIVDPGARLDGDPEGGTGAEAVVREIRELGGTAELVAVSVTDFEATGDLVADAVKRWGRLDVVVNNAGITRDRTLASIQEQDWDDVVAVHLKGTFNLTRHAAQHWRAMAKAGSPSTGRIINTTSGSAFQPNVGQAAYGAAKAAIASLTVTSAHELQRYGVTVNAISPVARTRMTSDFGYPEGPDGTFDPYAPENASPVVCYLASVASGWITGRVVRVDGSRLRLYEPARISARGFEVSEARALESDEVGFALQRLLGTAPIGLGDGRIRSFE